MHFRRVLKIGAINGKDCQKLDVIYLCDYQKLDAFLRTVLKIGSTNGKDCQKRVSFITVTIKS
jgi:hypothetical protein